MLRKLDFLLFAALVLSSVAVSAETELTYAWVFDATWSAETHPVDFPGSAHFSPPIGAIHDGQVVFWRLGELASPGIERMAETGQTGLLIGEITAAAEAGHASSTPTLGGFLNSPGTTGSTFVATATFDRLSWVSMLAPSPDWFVGVDTLPLRPGGNWIEQVEIPLLTYDSGTDNGLTFTSGNSNTVPAEPISLIVTAPLVPDGIPTPVGTLTIRLTSVDGLPPSIDSDGDGLTNLEEASAGTDPLDPDTDDDLYSDRDDNCPVVANPMQTDGDRDGVGDVCDVCPGDFDPTQPDIDADGEGDACDTDDGLLRWTTLSRSTVAWQDEPVYDTFNVYRGDLATLRAEGASAITQPPGGLADRFCDLTAAELSDDPLLDGGDAVYYLVTGVASGIESSTGFDGAGNERGNPAACP